LSELAQSAYSFKNANITWDIVRDNPDKSWSWYCISPKQSITWDIIKENPNRLWNWSILSENTDIILSDKERCTIIERHRSSKIIQKAWRRAVSDPNYIVCRKRLLWEFLEENGSLTTVQKIHKPNWDSI
jgi:hypothetical protein